MSATETPKPGTEVPHSGTHRVYGALQEHWRTGLLVLFGLILTIGAKSLEGVFLSVFSSEFAQHVISIEISKRIIEAISYGTEHLGVVLIVGVIIKVAIETNSQRQFLNLINDSVKTSIMNVNDSINELDRVLRMTIRRKDVTDEKSREVLEKRVLNPSVIRDEYDLHLTLEPLIHPCNDNPDLIKVRARTSYWVQNITDEPADYKIIAWVEKLYETSGVSDEDTAQFTNACYYSDKQQEETEYRHFNLDLEALQRAGKIEARTGGLWLEYPIIGGIPPKTKYYVDVEATQINRKNDLFVWNMVALTKKLSVTVQFAGGLTVNDFKVDARELHHIEDKDFQGTRKDNNADGNITWTINQVLLPYQGVSVWWSPTKVSDAGKSAASAS
jgi:hypothetical protein